MNIYKEMSNILNENIKKDEICIPETTSIHIPTETNEVSAMNSFHISLLALLMTQF